MFIKNSFSVTVAGTNITDAIRPLWTDIEYSHAAGRAASSASITLADQYGQVVMPQDRAPIQIEISGAEVFTGFVNSVSWSMTKDNGRTLKISAFFCGPRKQGQRANNQK
ncbi:MAG: hypothetical protein U5K75_10600 [Ahrensia sp.]|nr:hypothetical protein [Ahrensia sp.]